MAVTIKDTESKVTAPKRTITIKNAIVDELRFVDENGDVTDLVLEQIPDGMKYINVKIQIELNDYVDDDAVSDIDEA